MRLNILAATLLVSASAAPACAEMKKIGDWIAACDNAGKCVAYSLKRDTYHAYLKIERGRKSVEFIVTLALSTDQPLSYWIISDDPRTSLYPETKFTTTRIDADGYARFATEETHKAMDAFLRKAKKLTLPQADPPPQDPQSPNFDGISLQGA